MPIFQDPDHRYDQHRPWRHSLGCADECSTNELDEPVEGVRRENDLMMSDASCSRREMQSEGGSTLHTSSREELIRRIKRGESPTWVPSPAVSNTLIPCFSDIYYSWLYYHFLLFEAKQPWGQLHLVPESEGVLFRLNQASFPLVQYIRIKRSLANTRT